MILDTTYVIDLIRGEKGAVTKAEELKKKGEPLLTTAVTVFEVVQSLHRARKEEKQRVQELFSSLPALPLDAQAANEAGEIQQGLWQSGQPIEPQDCMIAAIALQAREILLTRNAKHFKRVPGLNIEEY